MVLGLCLIAPAAAADDGDRNFQARLEKGRAIAEANCSPCHAVGLTDASPTRVNANTAFRMLYERYPIPMLEEAAKTGSVSGHDEMPGFDFALEDARALLAYIDSLTRATAGQALALSTCVLHTVWAASRLACVNYPSDRTRCISHGKLFPLQD